MSRYAGRFVPNIEHEVRLQAVEPIHKWRQEWVLPAGTTADSPGVVRILKWVKLPNSEIAFPEEEDVQAKDRIQDDAAILEALVQSIHNAPAEPTIKLSVTGSLGTIAPKDPPADQSQPSLQAEAAEPSEMAPGGPEPGASEPSGAEANAVEAVSAIPAHLTHDLDFGPSTGQTTPDLENKPASMNSQSSTLNGTAEGTSGEHTPQAQPQVETQLHEQAVDGAKDRATLAVLAGVGEGKVDENADHAAETAASEEKPQPPADGPEQTAISNPPAVQEEKPKGEEVNADKQEDVEMKDE